MQRMNTMPLQHRHGGPMSVRRLRSLWPPVGPIERQEMKSRGPGIRPDSTAVLVPQSAPPASRTVVKPRSSMRFRRPAERAIIRVSGTASMRLM